MKKILLLIVLAIGFSSCEDEVSFSNPSVQGEKDNVFWRAADFKATVIGGRLTVSAYTTFEELTLTTSSTAPGTYILGENDINAASYYVELDGEETAYSTGTELGDGEIIIDQKQELGTISGKFKFNAPPESDPLGLVVNYQYGVFYKIPIVSIQ